MNIYEQRMAKLLEIQGVDAIALVPGTNLYYFTGFNFHLSERPMIALITNQGFSMIIPRLEMPNLALRSDLDTQPFSWDDADGYYGAFENAVRELGLEGKTLGIDGLTMRATEAFTFAKVDPTLNIKSVERELIQIRAQKTPEEIVAFRKAITASESALRQFIKEVQPGMTEKQAADRLNELMLEAGGDEIAFGTLMQSGVNSANPHGVTTDRVIQAGEFLLIDYGCKVDDYPADITRTFVMGEATEEMQKIYSVVQQANAAGRAAVKPGVTGHDVDAATRKVIEDAGYGEYFTHRTGHGLGLDTHEIIPQIGQNSTDVLQAGMVFTIEPGIYLPHLGGVRIEDNILVTENGGESLTQFPYGWRIADVQ